MKLCMDKFVEVMALCLVISLLNPTSARAQHGDWLLGTDGLLSAQQAPEGVLYQNLWSYYHASGNTFLQTGPIKCGPRGKICLGFNANGSGSLDLFVDQNIFWLVTPFKFLGASYGFLIDVPFAIADANGDASLEPSLSSGIGNVTLASLQRSPGTTKGTIGDIYFRKVVVLRLKSRLDIDGAVHCLDHAGELGEHAVASGVHEPSVMLLDLRIDQLAVGREGAQRRLLIFPHEAAVTVYVGAEYCGELPLHYPPLMTAIILSFC